MKYSYKNHASFSAILSDTFGFNLKELTKFKPEAIQGLELPTTTIEEFNSVVEPVVHNSWTTKTGGEKAFRQYVQHWQDLSLKDIIASQKAVENAKAEKKQDEKSKGEDYREPNKAKEALITSLNSSLSIAKRHRKDHVNRVDEMTVLVVDYLQEKDKLAIEDGNPILRFTVSEYRKDFFAFVNYTGTERDAETNKQLNRETYFEAMVTKSLKRALLILADKIKTGEKKRSIENPLIIDKETKKLVGPCNVMVPTLKVPSVGGGKKEVANPSADLVPLDDEDVNHFFAYTFGEGRISSGNGTSLDGLLTYIGKNVEELSKMSPELTGKFDTMLQAVPVSTVAATYSTEEHALMFFDIVTRVVHLLIANENCSDAVLKKLEDTAGKMDKALKVLTDMNQLLPEGTEEESDDDTVELEKGPAVDEVMVTEKDGELPIPKEQRG